MYGHDKNNEKEVIIVSKLRRMKMIKNKMLSISTGLILNFSSLCNLVLSMEMNPPVELVVFSTKEIVENINNFLPQENDIRNLLPLFSTCKVLHSQWKSSDFWSIKYQEYLHDDLKTHLNNSLFLRQILCAVGPHIQILKSIDIEYQNKFPAIDERISIGIRISMSDIWAKLLKSHSLETILNSMVRIKYLESLILKMNIGESIFSLIVQEGMWFGEIALISLCRNELQYILQLNSYTKYFTDYPYFDGFEDYYRHNLIKKRDNGTTENSDSDSESELYKNDTWQPDRPKEILRKRIYSLCHNEALFHNPTIAFFYGIITGTPLNVIYGYGFGRITNEIIRDYLYKHGLVKSNKDRYFTDEFYSEFKKKWVPIRKNLIETAIKANIKAAPEIYDHILILNADTDFNDPLFLKSPASSNFDAGDLENLPKEELK